MSVRWKLNTRELQAAQRALDALLEQAENLDYEWEDRSDRWRDGDTGSSVREWLDQAIGNLETARDELAELAENLEPCL